MKNIVITGTSRGIGLQLALLLAGTGHRILAVSRSVPSELLGNPNVTCVSADIADAESFARIVTVLQSFQSVDAIIHNAGALALKPFAETTPQDFEAIYRVNVFAVAELTRIALPYLVRGSHVVAISSMGGIQGSAKFAGLSAYSSSKGAVITLMELLAEEFRENGISFNALALGSVNTEMLAEAFPGYKAPLEASEMAGYIAQFALEGHKFYNGKVLPVSASTP